MRTPTNVASGGRTLAARVPRPSAMLAALVVLLPSMVVTGVAVSPAQAVCTSGNPVPNNQVVVLRRPSDNQELARETWQNSGTCDALGDYYGKVKDSRTDGSCAYAVFYEPNVGQNQVTSGVSCTTGAFSNFTFWDQHLPGAQAWMVLRTDQYSHSAVQALGF